MTHNDKEIEKLLALASVLDKGRVSTDDFEQIITVLVQFAKETSDLANEETQKLKKLVESSIKDIQEASGSSILESKQALMSLKTALESTIASRLASVKDGYTPVKGFDYADGKPGEDADPAIVAELVMGMMPELNLDTPEEIRDKLQSLEGDNRLDASAIKNLQKIGIGTTRVISGHGPLWGLEDVDVSGIVAGQSIKWDGTRWIPYTPSGGGNTPVYEEVPTDSGDHTNFTLAHTPVAGTLRLYRGGARQQVGIGKDYTLSGATITLSVVLNSAAGEILVADYEY